MSSRAVVMVALLAAASTVSAQSLTEIAAKEKARRERVRREGTEARTFSDRDLPRGREGDTTSEREKPAPDSRSGTALTLERKVDVEPPQAEGPSEMEKLKAKSALWRGRWREAKDQVEKLEKELAELEEEASHIAQIARGPETGPRPLTRAEYVLSRLRTVRNELRLAKSRLADVEASGAFTADRVLDEVVQQVAVA